MADEPKEKKVFERRKKSAAERRAQHSRAGDRGQVRLEKLAGKGEEGKGKWSYDQQKAWVQHAPKQKGKTKGYHHKGGEVCDVAQSLWGGKSWGKPGTAIPAKFRHLWAEEDTSQSWGGNQWEEDQSGGGNEWEEDYHVYQQESKDSSVYQTQRITEAYVETPNATVVWQWLECKLKELKDIIDENISVETHSWDVAVLQQLHTLQKELFKYMKKLHPLAEHAHIWGRRLRKLAHFSVATEDIQLEVDKMYDQVQFNGSLFIAEHEQEQEQKQNEEESFSSNPYLPTKTGEEKGNDVGLQRMMAMMSGGTGAIPAGTPRGTAGKGEKMAGMKGGKGKGKGKGKVDAKANGTPGKGPWSAPDDGKGDSGVKKRVLKPGFVFGDQRWRTDENADMTDMPGPGGEDSTVGRWKWHSKGAGMKKFWKWIKNEDPEKRLEREGRKDAEELEQNLKNLVQKFS